MRSTGKQLIICGLHLTEKVVGLPGQRQRAMIEAALVAATRYPCLPIVLAGDMNINQVTDLPPAIAHMCQQNPFMHPAPGHDPYDLLRAAGFRSVQQFAAAQGKVLPTVWNGACVDYLGSRGVTPCAVTILPPVYSGHVFSDHAFPVASFRF